MRLLLVVAHAYPWRTAATFVCLLLGGLAEGVGMSSLLPLLHLVSPGASGSLATEQAARAPIEQFVIELLRAVHLEPTTAILLSLIVAGMVLKAALVLLAKQQVGYTVAHVATDLRLGLIRSLLETQWLYFVHQPIGAFANAIASDARRASEAYLRATTILSLLVEAAVYITVAFLVSWPAALAALSAGCVVVYVLNRLVHVTRRAGARQTRLSRSLLTRLTDTLQTVKPVKAMGRENLVGPLLEGDAQRINRALQREVLSREVLRALQEPLIVALLVAGLYVGLTYAAMPLASLLVLALLCGQIVTALAKVQRELQGLAACESAYDALSAMIDQAKAAREVRRGVGHPTLRREITFERATFAYEDRPILRDATFTIPVGQMTVLVGPSGSGKTTVADLAIGLVEPQEGQILVDGADLRSLDAGRWRSKIGYVPQENLLLHDTVRVNVSLGDPELAEADIEAALYAAGASDFVAELPDGLDTVVGERGLRISGGQRQRIALARALVRRPELLVLDEATTGLDPATEASIGSTLGDLRGRMTILAIVHHGPLVELADQVLEIEQGAIRLRPSARLISSVSS